MLVKNKFALEKDFSQGDFREKKIFNPIFIFI